jgi:HK97 family phage portal protein
MLLKPSMFMLANANTPVDQEARGRVGAVREKSQSNEPITVENAITVSGVIAIITLIAQDTASLPLILYGRQSGGGRFRYISNPYYSLMHDAPNPEMSALNFRELIAGHLIAWGNFYAQMIGDKSGVVRELWPLRPDRMTVQRVKGEKLYKYITSNGQPRTFLRDEILHIPAFGFDGLVGYSRISLARNAIGLALATEKFGSKFFAKDARPGIVLEHPKQLSTKAAQNLKTSFIEEHEGTENSHGVFVAEEGMKVVEVGIPPEDAQFLETRKFQLQEINRILGPLPPHMLGDVERSTSWGSGIDSQEQGYVNHTLRAYTVRIEQALGQQLLLETDRARGAYFEHLFDGLLRGDIATRYEAYTKAITVACFMSRNEARIRENLNPAPGLDEFLVPQNMAIVGNGAPANQSAFDPLWQDVLGRVVKREANDVRGAARRFLAKGQTEEFAAWLDAFYSQEQPAFIRRQAEPLLVSMRNLWAIAGEAGLQACFDAYLAAQRAALEGVKSAEEVEGLAERWSAENPGRLAEQVRLILLDEYLSHAGGQDA